MIFNLFKKKQMVKHENQNLKNPNTTGVILVETAKSITGKQRGTECYQPNAAHTTPFRVSGHPRSHDGKFNPNKVAFFGEEIFVYAKNRTLKFNLDGTVEDLPVDTYNDAKISKHVERVNETYGINR